MRSAPQVELSAAICPIRSKSPVECVAFAFYVQLPTPHHSKQISMPSQESFRLHDVQYLSPIRCQSSKTDELDAIPIRQPWSFLVASEDGYLLT